MQPALCRLTSSKKEDEYSSSFALSSAGLLAAAHEADLNQLFAGLHLSLDDAPADSKKPKQFAFCFGCLIYVIFTAVFS